jgi:hypothetical protein
LGCFIFYGDPIYDIEGTYHIKDIEIISSEDLFLQPYGSYMCQPDDMVTYLFHPFEDDLMQHFQDAFQPPYSDFDRHQVVAHPKKSKVHTTKQNYFHIETFSRDFHTKKRHFLSLTMEFFSKAMPYSISSYLENHRVFFGSIVLSHPSGSSDNLSEDEYELSSMYNIPLQRWIDQYFGYTFRKDDWADGFSFQQDFLPPTHLHEFYFMIYYMCVHTHDYYVLDLSLLYYMTKHKGRHFDEMIKWFHWLYDFT